MSARYKISNKNIYGFKTNIYQMFLLIPVIWILTFLIEFGLGPILYKGYQKDVTPEEGAAGTEAGSDIPVAGSIADMEQMGTFTLITEGVVINHDTFRAGEEVYHYIKLPSGEKVIAHINKKAILETDEAGFYRLPAGV